MRFEAGFVACYALVLLAVAAGLHRLGKIDTSPWRSRVLAGHRRQVPGPPPADADPVGPVGPVDAVGPVDWPHSEARRLHTMIASVALTAALTLATVEVVRHHRTVEVLVLGAVAVAAAAGLVRLARSATRES